MRISKIAHGTTALYLAATLFALGTAFIKLASAHIPGTLISAIRFAVGIALAVPATILATGTFKVNKPSLVLARGLFGSVSMILSYLAIAYTAPGRATVLANTYPVWVAVMAALFFGEKIGVKTLASLVLCSLGALLIMRDGSGAGILGDVLAIVSAVFAGIAINFVRRASAHDNPFILYLSPCVFGLPFGLISGGLPESLPTEGLVYALIVGILAFGAQTLMARGYKTVPAGKGAVVFYFETVLTVAMSVVLFRETLNARFLLGLGVITTGLLLNGWRRRAPKVA